MVPFRVLQFAACVPSYNGKLLLVIDLQLFNCHLAKEQFHVGMPASLGLSIQKVDCVVSMDLTFAYFHV